MANDRSNDGETILCAVDFSECSAEALLWAARLAGRLEWRLLLVHVVHDPESAPGYYRQARKRHKHLVRMEEAAAEMMSEFLFELCEKHPDLPMLKELETELVVGLPVTRILDVARRSNADMIVMGSHGRTGLPHLFLGSKAAKVVQLSPIPVTIVKAAPEDD